jgi:capsular polysaccharide biosynthesis protein
MFKKHWQFILFITLFITALTLGLSFLVPTKYRSQARVLVVQQYGLGVDPYNLAKSTEYFTNLLAEVVPAKVFFDEVLNGDEQIDQSFFSPRPEKREKQWRKMVSVRPTGDTGILTISVYHPSSGQAGAVASSITKVLTTRGGLFHGAGDRLSIRVIDEPITSEKPVQPRIALNTILAGLIGLFFSLGMVFLKSTQGTKIL